MSTKLIGRSTPIFLGLLFTMLIVAYFDPANVLLFGVILLVSFLILSFAIIEKYKEANWQEKFPRVIFIRNMSIEIVGTLLTLPLAGLLSWYIVEYATRYVNHSVAKLILGMIIGLAAGLILGMLINNVTKYLVKVSSGN